jgi:hypothetical protein
LTAAFLSDSIVLREEVITVSKSNRLLIVVPVLIFASIVLSGCYTLVGYPPEVERGAVEVEPDEGQVYRYRGYYDTYSPYSYYWDYYDPYYDYWYPGYYYRDYYPWRYYGNYYYWDYGGRYVPEKRPEARRRGVEPQRSPRPERRGESSLEEDEAEKSNREVRDTRRDNTQRSVRQKSRDSSSDSSRRAPRRTSEDEEKNE